jgi:serine/threonine protein kinase
MRIKLNDLVLSRIKSLNSELIVNIIDYGFDNQLKRYYIIEEFYSLGSLSNFIKNNYELIRNNYKVIDSIINQLNEGIYLLHKNEILHKDIKSSNILIKEIIRNEQGDIEDIRVVISDFNISSMIPTEASKKITDGAKGTIVYMPPESFSKVITKKSDYWSLGMILYELLFRNLPFENIDTNTVIYKILTEDIQINKEIPIKYQILLRGLFIRNPEKRFYYEEVKKVLNAKDVKQLEKIEEELLIPLFSQGLNKKAEFKAEKTEFNDKVIIYNNKQYKNIDELIKEVEKDANIFYSIVYFIVKIVEDGSYKDLLRKEDIEIIDYYKNKVSEIKKVNDIKLVASLFISKKNGEFNLFGIRLNLDKLVEICKKYLDSTDLKELTAQKLNIIKLIKNYYLKKVDEYNIFEVYEISKIKNKVKNIALDRIFRQIKKIKINNSNINLLFSFIISLVQVKGFYELFFSKENIYLNNLNNKLDIVDFIVENGNDIFRYWDKALGKEKLKNILYNKILNSIKKKNSNFPNYNEEITKEIFFKAIQQGDKDSVEFLIFEVFDEEVLKNALYEAVEKIDEEKLKKILKEVLYKAIENNILKIINLISNFFTKKELEDILEYYDLEYDENDNIIQVREKKLFEDDKKTEFMSPFNKGKCKFLFNITTIDYIRYFDFFYK